MLVRLLLVIAWAFTSSFASNADDLTQKKAALEAKASTEKEEVLRWDELAQAAEHKFAALKRELSVLRTDLKISQDEVVAASNRVHCAQNKQAELDQLSCRLKNKLDEEYQRKLALERSINTRAMTKRKRSVKIKRQAPYPWSENPVRYHELNQRAIPSQNDRNQNNVNLKAEQRPNAMLSSKPNEVTRQNADTGTKTMNAINQRGNEVELQAGLDLSKLSDVELLRKSLDPIYRQTIDSMALTAKNSAADKAKSLVAEKPKKEVAPVVRGTGDGAGLVRCAACSGGTKESCEGGGKQKEEGESAELRKIKLEIFQQEALLRNVDEQLEAAHEALTAQQNRLDEISRKICGIRYELKDLVREAREKLEAVQQAQCQRAAHENILTDITKQLQTIAIEAMKREMDELTKQNPSVRQVAARATAR